MQQYMSVGDAAKALGVVTATVKLMLRNGRLIPAARTVGGMYLFDPADICRLAKDRQNRDNQLTSRNQHSDGEENAAALPNPR